MARKQNPPKPARNSLFSPKTSQIFVRPLFFSFCFFAIWLTLSIFLIEALFVPEHVASWMMAKQTGARFSDLKEIFSNTVYGAIVFAFVAHVLWSVSSSILLKVDGPGKLVPTLRYWLSFLVCILALFVLAAWKYDGGQQIFAVNFDIYVIVVASILFLGLFYLGSVIFTPPHLRGAIPGARFVP